MTMFKLVAETPAVQAYVAHPRRGRPCAAKIDADILAARGK